MPSESTTSAGRPPQPNLRSLFRPALSLSLAFLAGLLVILAIPLSARAVQPPQPSAKESLKQLPVAPAGVRAGLPYETRPAPDWQAPQRHGGPDAFGYVYDDEGETGSGVTYNWVDGVNRIPDI